MKKHNQKQCKENGGEESREFGFPIKSVQLWSYGQEDLECPACGETWSLYEDDPTPTDWVEDNHKNRGRASHTRKGETRMKRTKRQLTIEALDRLIDHADAQAEVLTGHDNPLAREMRLVGKQLLTRQLKLKAKARRGN